MTDNGHGLEQALLRRRGEIETDIDLLRRELKTKTRQLGQLGVEQSRNRWELSLMLQLYEEGDDGYVMALKKRGGDTELRAITPDVAYLLAAGLAVLHRDGVVETWLLEAYAEGDLSHRRSRSLRILPSVKGFENTSYVEDHLEQLKRAAQLYLELMGKVREAYAPVPGHSANSDFFPNQVLTLMEQMGMIMQLRVGKGEAR